MACGSNEPDIEPDIDLCICSYLRPEIVETLAAVARQSGIRPGRIRVIVADNSVHGEIRDRVLGAAEELGLNLHYVHAPANNISLARNACMDAARGRWIAFLDDDETPAPNWLAALLEEAERGSWDAVVGPVTAIYPAGVPRWLREGDFHSAHPVWIGNKIETAYTGNVLFARALAQKHGIRFRTELGNSGGEDEDFFYRFNDVGGRIGFAPRAVVYEPVEPQRANITWLLRRNFRAGQSHGSRLRRHNRVPADIAIAVAKAAACTLGATAHLASAGRRTRYLTRAALHCGVVARLAGLGEIKMY
jgi:succinoglycan biosynthesis protein ExoM